MNKLLWIVSLPVVALAWLAFTQWTDDEKDAAQNYQTYCASCHGANLRSFINRDWLHGNSWNQVYRSIAEGYPDAGMAAFDTTFTDTELAELTSYILTGMEEQAKESLTEKADQPGGIIESDLLRFRLDTIVGGDPLSVPWGLAFLPDGGLLITERDGRLLHHDKGALTEIKGVPEVRAKGQGGLLDVAIHPEFATNRYVYLSYSMPKGSDKQTTAVLRAKLQGNRLTASEVIFEATPAVKTRHHFGSRLVFDKEGYLFLSVGDRGRRDDHPQFLSNSCGKIHRIHDDGTIPEDNPFVGTPNAVESIWSYGHRNPQGLAIHPVTGELWENEHGPRGGDEINHPQRGKNYGWPVISYGINYNGTKFTDKTEQEGMEQPTSYWVPSIGVCGLTIADGKRYPAWEGHLFSGSLAFGYVHRSEVRDGNVVAEEKLLPNLGRVRAVAMSPDGYLYITKEDPGYVMRLVPVE